MCHRGGRSTSHHTTRGIDYLLPYNSTRNGTIPARMAGQGKHGKADHGSRIGVPRRVEWSMGSVVKVSGLRMPFVNLRLHATLLTKWEIRL